MMGVRPTTKGSTNRIGAIVGRAEAELDTTFDEWIRKRGRGLVVVSFHPGRGLVESQFHCHTSVSSSFRPEPPRRREDPSGTTP
ncbi:hypothetical protein HPP92_013786 [Vanilla planifolia]|uniref:Uncharacterized protein n=1 Tax=Vanilla planifolia TaxID=51239 RepID=A0A835R466_VANPL|nr:hypothetical protein HPP92_013786 [Vanilla planifolia]